MIIDITAGNKFPRWKLIHRTKKFFKNKNESFGKSKVFSKPECDFLIELNRNAVKIISAKTIKTEDVTFLKEYIGYVFNGYSIGIFASQETNMFDDI